MTFSGRDRLLACLLVLLVVTTAVFWRVRTHDFINLDDNILVYKNKHFAPVSAENLWPLWQRPHEQIYIPLTYTVWAGLVKLAEVTPSETPAAAPLSELSPRLDPSVFHSFNLLLHVLNALLVFGIFRVLLKNDWAALAGALLFALHPVQVESVAWVAELKGLLSGFFGLLALWLYVTWAKPRSDFSLEKPDSEADHPPTKDLPVSRGFRSLPRPGTGSFMVLPA